MFTRVILQSRVPVRRFSTEKYEVNYEKVVWDSFRCSMITGLVATGYEASQLNSDFAGSLASGYFTAVATFIWPISIPFLISYKIGKSFKK